MDKSNKAELVESVRVRFENAPFIALADFKGSTVEEMNRFRRACEADGVHVQVIKNTLSKRAIVGTALEGLSGHFVGNTAVFFAGEDAIAAAKLLKAQVKENKKLVVKAGYFDGDILDEAQTIAVASLPSREELLSLFLRTIQEGPRQVMGVIRAPARDLLYLLSNYATKLEEGS